MSKRELQLKDYQKENQMSNMETKEDNYTPEQLEPTTTCDDCGRTGPINSTNYNPITEQILCPTCDAKE